MAKNGGDDNYFGKGGGGTLGDIFGDEFESILSAAQESTEEPKKEKTKKIKTEIAPKVAEKPIISEEEARAMELEGLRKKFQIISDEINHKKEVISAAENQIENIESLGMGADSGKEIRKLRNKIEQNKNEISKKEKDLEGVGRRIREVERVEVAKATETEPAAEPQVFEKTSGLSFPSPGPELPSTTVEIKNVPVVNKNLDDERRKIQNDIKGHESAERQILGAILKEKDASRKTNLEKNLNRIKADLEKYRNSLAVIEAEVKKPSMVSPEMAARSETVEVENEPQKLDSFPEGFRESTRALVKEIGGLTDKDGERMEEISGEIETIIDIFQTEINQIEELLELSEKRRKGEVLSDEEKQKIKLIALYKKEGIHNPDRELSDLYDALDFWERKKEKVSEKIMQLKEKETKGEIVPIEQEGVKAEVIQEIAGEPVLEIGQKEPEIVFSSVSARDHFRGLGSEAKMYVLGNFKQNIWDNTIDKVKFAYSEKLFNWHEKIAAKIDTKNKKIDEQIKALQGEKEKGVVSISRNMNNVSVDAIRSAETGSMNRGYLIDLETQRLVNKKHRLEGKLFNRMSKRDAYVSRLKSLAENVSNRISWLTMPFKARLENLDAPKKTIDAAVKEHAKNVKQWETSLTELKKKLSDPKYNSIKSMIKRDIDLAESNLMIAKNSAAVVNLGSQLKFIGEKMKKVMDRIGYWEKIEKEFQGKVPKATDYLKAMG